MKKLLLLPLALLAMSCGTLVTTYSTKLVSVESPENAKEQYGESKIANSTNSDGLTQYTFEDDNIQILWYFTKMQMNFTLKNKCGHSIKLPWDDMAFVNAQGQSMRVLHKGIKYVDKNEEQAPSIVAKNASLSDILVVADAIQYYNYGSWQFSGWSVQNFLPQYKTQEDANTQFKPLNVRVVFPIVIEGTTNEYIFEFVIDEPVVKRVTSNGSTIDDDD